MFTRWIWIGLGWSVAAILLTLLFLLGLPPLPIAAQTLPPPPANERTLTVTDSLTPTLPDLHYALAPAVTLSEAPGLNASSELTLSLPLTPSEKATLLELATLFFYDPATQRWLKLPTRRTVSGDQLYLTAPSQGPGRYAPALSTASDIGTYEQPWAPNLAAAQVDLFTGALSWSYPLDLPSGRSGQTPPLALTYHSGLLDALRGDFNPQASWVGLGWNLDVGYIARRIELDENFLPRYTQDFFLVLNGVSSKLVAIGPDQWRAEDERFWRVQRQTTPDNRGGDFWLLTTPDGTQYRFGSQDEKAGDDSRYSAWWMVGSRCDHSEALCIENWRWNLDQITSPEGNHIRFDYRVERNNYAFRWGFDRYFYADFSPCPDGAWECRNWIFHDHRLADQGYIRGGSLAQITYSWPQASHKIRFEVEERDDYPPYFDSSTHGIQPVQTFWTKARLRAIEIFSQDQNHLVKRYELRRDENDHRLLAAVSVAAADGTRLPDVSFGYLHLAGYLEQCRDGQPEGGWKPWLLTIENGYGATLRFNYTAPENRPWFQNGQLRGPLEEGRCWYRYRVRELTVDPGLGPVARTLYEYRQAEGDAPHDGTWEGDEFRGHPRVRIQQRLDDGSPGPYTDVWFYQGRSGPARPLCDGEQADQPGLEGREYRRVTYEANGQALTQQIQRWEVRLLDHGRRFIAPAVTCAYPNDGSGPYARTDYRYDDYGNLIFQQHLGDVTRTGDEVTLEWRYVVNLAAWILNRPAESRRIAADGLVEAHARLAYDQQPFGAPPQQGLATWTAQGLDGWGWISATTHYDAWGQPDATTDPLGRTARIAYSANGLFPLIQTNPLNQSTAWTWDERLHVPTAVADAHGLTTHLQHDSFARVTGILPPGKNVPSLRYTYPSGSRIAAPFVIQTETRTDPYLTPTYRHQWTFYDGLGRVIQTQQEAENGWIVVQSTAYNALGQAVVASAPYTVAATGGRYLAPTWNQLVQTRTAYDALGRPVQLTLPGNSLTRYAYRHWSQLTLDANGHQRRYDQDGLGRLIAVQEYSGAFPAPDWNAATPIVTRYQYNSAGQLMALQDSLGHITRLTYDPLGRKIALDDPSLGQWRYRYDAAGNLIQQTDAEGHTLDFRYDPLNRLLQKRSGETLLAEYGYDQGDYALGKRTAMTDTLGSVSWSYDLAGRPVGENRTLGPTTYSTQWNYNAAGEVILQALPSGEVLDLSYNARGLLQQMHSRTYNQNYLQQAAYEAQGRPLQQSWGNGLTTRYTYAPDTLQLQALQLSNGLLDLRYQYDPVGNVTTIQDPTNQNQRQTFTYDAWDRLTTAQTDPWGEGQYQESYQYDWMGNLTAKTVDGQTQTYTYGRPTTPISVVTPVTLPYRTYLPLAFKRCGGELPCSATLTQPFAVVATSAGFQAAYDRNGNMILRVVVEAGLPVTYTLAYNVENQLAALTNTVTLSVTRYYYDGDGVRIKEEQQGADGRLITILRLGQVEIETAGNRRTVRTHYRIGGQPIAQREGTQLTYLHGDALGSSSLATGSDGGLLSHQRYRPFGEIRSSSTDTFPTAYQFTGQRNTGLGLYDYHARFYDPALGRFIQADALVPEGAFPQALNRYAYVYNNPLRYVDGDGHAPKTPPKVYAPSTKPYYTRGSTAAYLEQFHQYQNSGSSINACGPTNVAMALSLAATEANHTLTTIPKEDVEAVMEPDRIPLNIEGIGGATPVDALVTAFNKMAQDANLQWVAERKSHGTKEDLINCIKAGYLVTVLFIWPENKANNIKGGGHYVLVIGFDELNDTFYYLDSSKDPARGELPIQKESWDSFNAKWGGEDWWSPYLGYKNEMIIYKPNIKILLPIAS